MQTNRQANKHWIEVLAEDKHSKGETDRQTKYIKTEKQTNKEIEKHEDKYTD